MNIACFGQQNWDVCWTGKQQLMTRLAARGHRVLYADPDPADAAGGGGGLREVEPGLFIHTSQPGGSGGGRIGHRLRARRRKRDLAAAARRVGLLAPIALALRPDRAWLIDPLRPAARAYYAVDEWTGFGGLSDEARARLRREEERTLAACDVALAVSPRLVERFRRIQPLTHLLENGADVEHFGPASLSRAEPHTDLAGRGGPVLGYVGQIDERLDVALLAALADARPDWTFAFAGRVKNGFDAGELARRPNVRLLGYQPYAALPGVVRAFDACLAPYVRSPLTESCNPLKVFEYLATGKPTVATPVEGLRACRGAAALAEDFGGWLAALDAAVADPSAGRAERLAVAAANTWDSRADALEVHLRDALDRARAAGGGRSKHWAAGRRVARLDPRLDAKDASVRHQHRRWATAKFGPGQTAAYWATRAGGRAYYALRRAGRLARGDRAAVRNILVVRRACLGDMVVLLPMLAAVRRKYPAARIVLGVPPGSGAARLLAGVGVGGPVDEVRELDFWEGPRRRRVAGMARLFAEGFDLVLGGVWYFMMPEALFAGAPFRAGLHDGHPHQRLLSRAVPIDPARHEAENNLALAEAVGASAEGVERLPALPLDESRVSADGEAAWAALGLPAGAKVVAMHPGSKRPTRRWPAERFAALAADLLAARPDLHVVLSGVAEEADLVRTILNAIPPEVRGRARDGVGLSTLHALVGLLDRAAALVCNDTGTMHLARSRGTPLVAVLGPENDRRWGPHPLGPGRAISLKVDVPCAPCIRWKCESMACLKSTGTAAVLAEVESLLDGPRGAGNFAVERKVTRLSWRDVADAGHALPRVAVVLFPDARWTRGWSGPTGGRLSPGDLADARAAVGRQDYPNATVSAVQWRGSDPAAAWAAALAAAGDAAFVLPASPADVAAWPAGKIGRDVATAYRSHAHGADAAGGPFAFDRLDLHAAAVGEGRYAAEFIAERLAAGGSRREPVPPARPLRWGQVTFRRAALAECVARRFAAAEAGVKAAPRVTVSAPTVAPIGGAA